MLFLKEMKKVVFSLTFLLYFAAVLAMYFTQFAPDCETVINRPQPGWESYGTTIKEIPEIIMPKAIDTLLTEYLYDSFEAYPFGFYKEVKLNEKKRAKMQEIICELTGFTGEELDRFTEFEAEERIFFYDDGQEEYEIPYQEAAFFEIKISDDLTYERFRELMRQADAIIGGGSRYSDDNIVRNFSVVPRTYEDALEEYNEIFEKDQITGAYARLFCDYLGIVVAVLPVFVAAAFVAFDRRSRMEQLIYTRKISSAKLIGLRYLALCVTMMIPVVLAAVIAQMRIASLYSGYEMNHSILFGYVLVWLMPNIMTAAAVGMLLTELTSPLLAVFLQGAWWILGINSQNGLTGKIGNFTLVVRHNTIGERALFLAERNVFIRNRMIYTLLSILMVLLTIMIYEKKRRGSIHGFFHIQKNSGG